MADQSGAGAERSHAGGPCGALLAGAVSLAVCLIVVYATPRGSFWIVDCGNKALVAARLLETGYRDLHLEHPAAEVDPTAAAYPIRGFAARRGDGFVSIFPPAYPALAAPFLAALGPPGLRVPAALGVGASAALFALWLTPALGRRRAALGGLILALATPLFFYGVTVWEHSPTVALSIAAWLAASRDSARRLLLAGFLAGAACWLREELVLMVGALSIACALRGRRLAPGVVIALGASLPIIALGAVNQLVFGDPLGPHVTQNVTPGEVAAAFDPGRFARQTFALFGGFGTSPAQSAALALLALLPVVAGFASASRGRGVRTVAWLSGGAAILLWLFGTATIGLSERPLGALIHFNGLMITMPLAALAGFGLARAWRDPRCETLRVGILAGGLFLLAMSIGGVAVQDVFGFGVHWGPRMLLPALPAVLAPSLLCLLDAPARQRVPRTVFAALVVASLLASAQATWLLVEQKREGARLEAALEAHPQIYVVTRADYLAQQLAGLWDRKRFLLVETNPALRTVIGGMSARGVRDFLFVVPPDTPDIDWIPGARCAGVHRHRGRRLHYLDYDIQRCELWKES